MKLKKRISFRKVFISLYTLAFAMWLVIGLQPAEATNYEISASLNIPSINLTADVATLTLNNNKLDTPDTIVGSYTQVKNKTLLIGHSSTVFENLKNVKLNDRINYGDGTYRVASIKMTRKENISMHELLKSEGRDTVIIMTCAGKMLGGGDATHRLMLTAVR